MKPNECKHCGTRIPILTFGDNLSGFAFTCSNCGSKTRLKKGFEEAITAWNEGDWDWVEVDHEIKKAVDENNGYCPCAIWHEEDTLCPCKEFRDMEEGVCNCGRFEMVKEN